MESYKYHYLRNFHHFHLMSKHDFSILLWSEWVIVKWVSLTSWIHKSGEIRWLLPWTYSLIFRDAIVLVFFFRQIILKLELVLLIYYYNNIYPEWPHRQGGCLACCGCTFDSAKVHWFILCTRRSEGTAHEGGGCDQSIGSTVSDAIVHSWS